MKSSIQIQLKQQVNNITTNFIDKKLKLKSLPDPIQSSLYFEYEEDVTLEPNKTIGSKKLFFRNHTRHKTQLSSIEERDRNCNKSRGISVEFPKVNNKFIYYPINRSNQIKERHTGGDIHNIEKKRNTKQAIKNNYEKKCKFKSNLGMKTETNETKKTKNIKDRILTEKSKKRGKLIKHQLEKQWKRVEYLQMKTYFVKSTDSKSFINSLLQSNQKNGRVSSFLPVRQQISNFIKHYIPKNPEIIIDNLVRSEQFKVSFAEGETLYFGEVNNEDNKHGLGVEVGKLYRFEGSWKNNKIISGYLVKNEGYYKGDFSKGKQHGKGDFIWNNGEKYNGQWVEGKKHGSGMWTSSEGDLYIGQWKKGVVSGYGVHAFKNGQRYEGQFLNFLKHGFGRQSFPNNDYFEGTYQQGLPNGDGKYTWKNGMVYKGSFSKGQRSGEGEIFVQNLFRFKGKFKHDLPNGYGEILYSNHNQFKGNFSQGKKHGKGMFNFRSEHKILIGIWENNEFIADLSKNYFLS